MVASTSTSTSTGFSMVTRGSVQINRKRLISDASGTSEDGFQKLKKQKIEDSDRISTISNKDISGDEKKAVNENQRNLPRETRAFQKLTQYVKGALFRNVRSRPVTSCAVRSNRTGDSIVCFAEPAQGKELCDRTPKTPLLFYVKTGSNLGKETFGTVYDSFKLEKIHDIYRINSEPRLMKVQVYSPRAMGEAHNLKNQRGSLCAGINCSNFFYVDMLKLPGKSMDQLDCHNWNIGKKLKFGLALLDYADAYTCYGMILPDLNPGNVRYDEKANEIHFIDSTRVGHAVNKKDGSGHGHGLVFAAPEVHTNDNPAEKTVVYSLGMILLYLFFEQFFDIVSRLKSASYSDEMAHTASGQKNILNEFWFKTTDRMVRYDSLFIDQYNKLFIDMIAYDEKKRPELATCLEKFTELVKLHEYWQLKNSTNIYNDSSPTDMVLEQFYEGRTLARMLFNNNVHNCDWENDQLYYTGVSRSKSVSLMIPKMPCSLFSNIGYILDADKTVIRLLDTHDLGTTPVTSEGNTSELKFVSWNSKSHRFWYYSIRTNTKRRCTYFGRFTSSRKKMLSILDLPRVKKKKLMEFYKDTHHLHSDHLRVSSSSLGHNELLVNYNKESIIGIVAAMNKNYFRNYGLNNNKIKEQAIKFRDRSVTVLDKILPVYLYDSLTGKLELF